MTITTDPTGSRFPNEPFLLPGYSDTVKLAKLAVRYNYERDKIICPVCGGVGIPWNGWFHCEGSMSFACRVIAWMETGEILMPVAES